MVYMFINFAVEVMVFLIFIRCFLSFIPHNPYNSIWRFVYDATEPLLEVCARVLPDSLKYPMDFTPMVALLLLQMIIRPILMTIVGIIF